MRYIHYQTKDDSTYKKEYILDGVANSTLNVPYGHKSADQVLDVFTPVKGEKPYPTIVYIHGGGLKQDNAAMLASIPEIDGGLIALTRFQGEIGFYPDEYLEIIRIYMTHCAE